MKIMKNLEELKAEKLEIEEKLESIKKEIRNQTELQTFSEFKEDKYYRVSFEGCTSFRPSPGLKSYFVSFGTTI